MTQNALELAYKNIRIQKLFSIGLQALLQWGGQGKLNEITGQDGMGSEERVVKRPGTTAIQKLQSYICASQQMGSAAAPIWNSYARSNLVFDGLIHQLTSSTYRFLNKHRLNRITNNFAFLYVNAVNNN